MDKFLSKLEEEHARITGKNDYHHCLSWNSAEVVSQAAINAGSVG